jgi:hypothetical protein
VNNAGTKQGSILRHFEERKTEIMQHVQNIQYGYLLNKYLK